LGQSNKGTGTPPFARDISNTALVENSYAIGSEPEPKKKKKKKKRPFVSGKAKNEGKKGGGG